MNMFNNYIKVLIEGRNINNFIKRLNSITLNSKYFDRAKTVLLIRLNKLEGIVWERV